MRKLSSDKTMQISQIDEVKSLIYKITDKQQRFTELSTLLEENICKTICLVQKQFEKGLKRKKKEIRALISEHEYKVKEIQQEFQANQEHQATIFTTTKNQYLQIVEELYHEQQQFINMFDQDDIQHNNSYIMMIYEVLTDSTFFLEDQRLNVQTLNDYIHQQKSSKLLLLHNSLKQIIQQLLKIEENISHSKNQEKWSQNFQLLLQRLNTFIQTLKLGLRKLDELYSEIQNCDFEIKHQEKIIQNNIQLIFSLMKEHQDKQQEEESDLINSNEKLFKVLNKLKEEIEKLKHYQRSNIDDFKQFIELINIKGEKIERIKQLEPINRKSTMKIVKPILLQRTRIYSDSKQDSWSNKEQLSALIKNDNLYESQNLYQSLEPKCLSNTQLPSLSEISQSVNQQNNFSISRTKFNFNSKDLKVLKAGQIVDKKTAIPLKCSCPPQCLCQAQLIAQTHQTHQCNNQLYINSRGEILCQKCNFQQEVWQYNFICPQNKQKQKFRTSQEFLDAIWGNIKTLTINEQIAEFWGRLQVSCYFGFQTQQQISEDEQMVNFMTRCPMNCKCKHRESFQQFHFCNTALQITKSGQLYCKKCHIYVMLNQQFVYCQETEKYNLFSNFDDFFNAVEVGEYGEGNLKYKAHIFNKFDQRHLLQSWID